MTAVKGLTTFDAFKKVEPLKMSSNNELGYSERKFFNYNNLQFEIVRRATFKHWPVKFIQQEDLARSGLFYLHRNDLVQCYFCRGVIAYWEENDIPDVEHKKHYPNCRFVQGMPVTNVPHDGTKKHAILEKIILSKLDGVNPPERKKLYQTDSARIRSLPPSEKGLQFPDYYDKEKRRGTFADPPQNLPPAEAMVEAGFFRIGLSDLVHCYMCGGGVFNWSKNEDPLTIHANLYPNCTFVRETMISAARENGSIVEPLALNMSEKRKSRSMDPNPKRLDDLSLEDKKELYKLPLVEKLAVSGFGKQLITDALLDHLDRYGTLPVDVSQGTEIVFDYEDMLEDQKRKSKSH